MGWIYFIRSPSLREYVGQTIHDNVNVRWNEEKRKPHGRLKQVFEKYGTDKCEFFTIMEISQETHGDNWMDYLNMYEDIYIKERNTLTPNGYNLMTGGGNSLHSDETKQKMSDSKMGKTHSDETKQKISDAKMGIPLSDETKQKMSETRMGIPLSDETKQKMSDAKPKKPVEQWDGDFLIKVYPSMHDAEIQTLIHRGNISKVCKGKLKTAGGYTWKYYAQAADEAIIITKQQQQRQNIKAIKAL